MTTNYPRFGQRLRELRKASGLNQRQLAEAVGVHFTYISKMESGTYDVRMVVDGDLITRIAKALNVAPDDLLIQAGRLDTRRLQMIAAADIRAARLLFAIQAGTLTEAQWQALDAQQPPENGGGT